jgi:hypothetical protein
MSDRARIDREALLAALVLSPATYSRNRFFELYQDPAVRRVRRRASQIRSVVRHVTGASAAEPGEIVGIVRTDAEHVELTYAVPALGLRRTVVLDPLEVALVRLAVEKSGRASPFLPPDASDRGRVDAALARLSPEARPPAPADARG